MKFDIKIYEDKDKRKVLGRAHQLEEMETIRDLTESQKITIVSVLERHNIQFRAIKRG